MRILQRRAVESGLVVNTGGEPVARPSWGDWENRWESKATGLGLVPSISEGMLARGSGGRAGQTRPASVLAALRVRPLSIDRHGVRDYACAIEHLEGATASPCRHWRRRHPALGHPAGAHHAQAGGRLGLEGRRVPSELRALDYPLVASVGATGRVREARIESRSAVPAG